MKYTVLGTTLALAAAVMLPSCNNHSELPALGDTHLQVFQQTPVCFRPDTYENYNTADADSVIRLVNGRIILKKINLPAYRRDVDVTLKVTLASNGDRWDKSGSCFVLPKESAIHLMNIAQGTHHFPAVDSTRYEKLLGIVPGEGYVPTLELMRFMTPFGVGHYSDDDDPLSKQRRPVYIPKWEKSVTWIQDITALYPALEQEAYVGIYIDTWTPEGYVVSMDLDIQESQLTCDAMPKRHVKPLLNTVYYIGQEYPDIFSRKDVEVDFDLPQEARNVRLKYIVTGHGGHSGGDEFVQKRNIVSLDGREVLNFIPWRDDCASFRRYNPATGVWLIPRKADYIGPKGYMTKSVEEPLASSDLSRSNWCPGSDVVPEVAEVGTLAAGKHTLKVSIPEAQACEGNKLNHWLVSAYLVWEE
ncbi:hypothetical protein, secreted [gut metagenome]|uniref:Peptide-N-glycosidase F N-terminal domain-containing protein n=1 Tax=gut metagenome TaxID=749906 RepID=J9FP51_9ZZZZ